MKFIKTLTLISLFATSLMSQSAPYSYTDWTTATPANGTAAGIITYPDLTTVAVNFTTTDSSSTASPFLTMQNSSGTNYWTPTSIFTSPQVNNAPTNASIIELEGLPGGATQTYTLTFAQPITDPILAIVSLGGANTVTYTFNDSFTIVSQGTGIFGGSPTSLVQTGNNLTGDDGHGTIQFSGTFSSLSWSTTNQETWHGFTVGVKSQNIIAAATRVPALSLPALFLLVVLLLLSFNYYNKRTI